MLQSLQGSRRVHCCSKVRRRHREGLDSWRAVCTIWLPWAGLQHFACKLSTDLFLSVPGPARSRPRPFQAPMLAGITVGVQASASGFRV